VSHEWRKSLGEDSEVSTLHGIPWYRVVLDEGEFTSTNVRAVMVTDNLIKLLFPEPKAHTIRNRNTDRARSIKELHAERRWCVTGTPIQNSMDDIAGLLLFLRLEPFDHYDTFRDYIRMPLERGHPTGLKRLQTLIHSFTLRRVKGTVELPQRKVYTNNVELDPHERQLYDNYIQQSKYLLDKAIKTPGTRHAKTALQIILNLRLICDHGQDLLSSSEETYRDLLEEDIEAEIQQEIDANEIPNPITHYQELCCQLSQSSPSISPPPDPEGDAGMFDAYDGPTIANSPISDLQITDEKTATSTPKCQPKFPNYSGPSSKVRALLAILQKPKEEWRHSNGPIKR